MIGTVERVAITNGTIVSFVEGAIGSAVWTPSLILEIDSTYQIYPTEYITTKTITGFTVTGLLNNGYVFGTVSDGDAVDTPDPLLNANAIVTLNQVKTYLNKTDTTEDAFLTFLINQVSDQIERYSNSKVALQSFTGTIFNGNGRSRILAPFKPIYQVGLTTTALTDLQFRGSSTEAWESFDIDVDAITINDNYCIELTDGTVFPYGTNNLKLNHKSGYSTIPGTFVMVAIEEVISAWKKSFRGSGLLGVGSKSFSEGGGSETAGGGIVDLSKSHKQAMIDDGLVFRRDAYLDAFRQTLSDITVKRGLVS